MRVLPLFSSVQNFRSVCLYVSEYFEHGMVVDDIRKLRDHYVSSTAFKLDVVSLLPTDLVVSEVTYCVEPDVKLYSFTHLPTDLVFLVSYQSHVVIARLNRVLRMPTSRHDHSSNTFCADI